MPFVSAPNKFAALSAHDAMVNVSAALRTLGGALMKIANDVRWHASGPRAGLGEITIPDNEPGSSIMPGKINPTQCEALTMVAVQVFGNDAAVAFAGSAGQLPAQRLQAGDAAQRARIDRAAGRRDRFVRRALRAGHRARPRRASGEHVERSLMLVTALNPHIGYEKAGEDRADRAPRGHEPARGRARARARQRRGFRSLGGPRRDDAPRLKNRDAPRLKTWCVPVFQLFRLAGRGIRPVDSRSGRAPAGSATRTAAPLRRGRTVLS